ncbi:MAG: GspE/PulE family protein [Armatimonadota bacterium]
MEHVTGRAEILTGSKSELHIAPEGLALLPQDEGQPQAVRWSEVERVDVDQRSGRISVVLRGDRGRWTITGVPRPHALWAQDAIERELTRARARGHDIFRQRATMEQLAESITHFAEAAAPEPTVIAELICVQAVRNRATDVHLQPVNGRMRVRMRVDGMLLEAGEVSREVGRRVLARLKVLAEMKSYARETAQTGRMYLPVDERTVDIRLTCMPTVHGEKLTLRIFDPEAALLDVEALGMEDATLARWREVIHAPDGCVITTGPAGAGKTTSIYAGLTEIRNAAVGRAISTVEEPVELDLDGVDQTEIDRDRGLDFAAALRTVLRQDPQVIMVGEVRDRETAEIAMQAALTGHLVLTTVHAPDAAGVFARLMDLGLEPYVVASPISAVLAQRLVRTVCPDCAAEAEPDPEALRAAGLTERDVAAWTLRQGAGCERCAGTGYRGRTGIFELLPMTDELREAILQQRSVPAVERIAADAAVTTLWNAGLAKIREGETTLEELVRVLGRRER